MSTLDSGVYLAISQEVKDKIALFCDVDVKDVFESLDVSVLYEVIINLFNQHVDDRILKHFGYDQKPADINPWIDLVYRIKHLKEEERKHREQQMRG